MSLRPVLVTIATGDGSTHESTFRPGSEATTSQEEYNAFALGHLIAMVVTGYSDPLALTEIGDGLAVGTMQFIRDDEEKVVAHNYLLAEREHTNVIGFSLEVI
jgi:hypothetical protein